MTTEPTQLVLPRPGAPRETTSRPVPAPTEAAFTGTFGKLLPPAQFLTTPHGRAAYYELPPPASDAAPGPPGQRHRVLFLHGVQTPALGMLPLARALRAAFPRAHCALADWWGHGLSETPVEPHGAALFHRQLDALLGALGWPAAHLVCFSFGCAAAASYVASGRARRRRVQSIAFVAPAGFLRGARLTELQRSYMRGGPGVEDEARAWVLGFLEGAGGLVVPADWEARVARGEVVAEALRGWQMRAHPGHAASVVAMFRDGPVFDNDADFASVAGTGLPCIFVLGGLDDLCSRADLEQVGFSNIKVVPGAGHGVVRDKVPEVAGFIGEFWKQFL